ncbi:replication-relaxation family protein [Streptomyces sp. TLI_185]|uniref:replication-relaxation family protein n=1 Tax=Streptomyces sp. TLI_185 TaxID=2485151 RepID=UPI000F4DF484|nr:replication-relaxation family protein [Streptomyces sp. TLI_185]RPF30397.1 protein involved in plasmid replication-relaxation [Streptomyces sp. TLI_185]
MRNVDAGGGDRLALAVLAQYRMATTEQMHLIIAPGVRIEQTWRRLAKLRDEGLVDRSPCRVPAGRGRGSPPSTGQKPPRSGRSCATGGPPGCWRTARPPDCGQGHSLVVTETGLAFLQDARRRGEVCRPLDWIPKVYHPLGSSEAVIPDAVLFYRSGREGDDDWSMLRAFVEVDRATMGPERLAAKLTTYARLYAYTPVTVGRPRNTFHQEPARENWRRRYPLFPRLLFILDSTGPTGIDNPIRALRATARDLVPPGFVHQVPILAPPLTDLLHNGPSAPVWHPDQNPDHTVSWTHPRHP